MEPKNSRLIPMTSSPPTKATQCLAANSAEATLLPAAIGRKRNPTIEDFNFPPGLPTADDLPCSDGKPVDSILQELLPGLLKAILIWLWQERTDWLFGIDLGFHYRHGIPPVAPDGMLCLGVKKDDSENLRSSYVLWQENVIPLFALEVISKTAGGERTEKMDIYESVGILYYLIYAPLLKRKTKFQLYKLIEGEYVLQSDGKQPYWMPEIGLGIGVERLIYLNTEREWLFWYDEQGQRYLTPSERMTEEKKRAEAEKQRAEAEKQRAEAEKQRAEMEKQRAEMEKQRAEIEKHRAEAAEQESATERQRAEVAEQGIATLRKRLLELGVDPDSLP
jgi:Putative restriction endonuclease